MIVHVYLRKKIKCNNPISIFIFTLESAFCGDIKMKMEKMFHFQSEHAVCGGQYSNDINKAASSLLHLLFHNKTSFECSVNNEANFPLRRHCLSCSKNENAE